MDYRSPIYLQIKDTLYQKIVKNEYLPGSSIPSERKLAELYGVNRMTVKKAIQALVNEGYLYTVHGKGTFVQKEDAGRTIYGATTSYGMSAMFKELGAVRHDKVIAKGVVEPSNYLSFMMHVEEHDPIYLLNRIRYADGIAFAIQYCYMPFQLFEDIDTYNFTEISLYDYMDSRSHLPHSYNQKLIIIEADTKLAKQLEIEVGSPIFYFEYIGFNKDGIIVEFTESYIRYDMAEFLFEAHKQ